MNLSPQRQMRRIVGAPLAPCPLGRGATGAVACCVSGRGGGTARRPASSATVVAFSQAAGVAGNTCSASSAADGRAVKLLYVVDEFTREALAMEAERRIDADKVVDILDRIVRERGRYPEFVRCDNGPEMTSNALRDWCRFSRTGAAFIEPGSPWENPFVESFNSRVRDELLAVEVFSCLTEAKVMVADFRDDYNRRRPHRAHGMMTPAAFKLGWETAHQAAPACAELHDRYAIAPFDAGGSLTMKSPTNHQLSQQMDR